MLATRQFGACFLVMLATAAILLATTQFLPQLVQQDFGYTATWAGLVLSPGAHSRMYLGIGLPLIFVPIMTASYEGIPSAPAQPLRRSRCTR
jgi:DHA2 family multidrug resistance protein